MAVQTVPDEAAAQAVEERILLEGPHSRLRELRLVLRAVRDFISGFRALHFAGPCVTVFGSARFTEGHPAYAQAREVGRRLALLGFTVMTGGGPGVMEGANRGAREAGGRSVGCNIHSYAFVALPGGLGTLDEVTEALTLLQTGKIQRFPVVLLGAEYWRPFHAMLERMVAAGTLSATDLNLLSSLTRWTSRWCTSGVTCSHSVCAGGS